MTARPAWRWCRLPLALVKGQDGLWRVLNPEGDLGKLREALLARTGGRLPAPDDIKRRATGRDALRSFAAGFQDWSGSGRAQVMAALDLSPFSEAARDYEGELAATYLDEAMDRIGEIVPQEVPEVEGAALPDVPSTYMTMRRWVRDTAPALFACVGSLEAWQALGLLVLLVACFLAAFAIGWVLRVVLRRTVGGRQAAVAAAAPHVQPGSVQVGLGSLAPEGIEVNLSCRLDVRTTAEEQAARTVLMLDILRAAERLRLRLGGPDAAPVAALAAVA